MSAAERLKPPIKAVFASGGKKLMSGFETNISSHVFVRWKFDDKNWLNFECGNGKLVPDSYYKERYFGLTEIPNFQEWLISTRLERCAKEYGTNYSSALKKTEELQKRLR